jgi:putative transposase
MARQARTVIPGQAMHVMVRGNNRQTLFFSDEDRRVYLDWLKEAAKQFACSVHAFVLMPNHVHLLVTPSKADSLAKTMQSLGRRYAQYFNQQHHRSGTIWEGRFRSSLIDPSYFLRCQRYIELNPVRVGFESSPQDSTWSSYPSHTGQKVEPWLVDHESFWNLGNTPFERQMAWAGFIKEGAPHWEDRQITEALLRSKPWLSDALAQKLFKDRPDQLEIRHRGRPKKENTLSIAN